MTRAVRAAPRIRACRASLPGRPLRWLRRRTRAGRAARLPVPPRTA